MTWWWKFLSLGFLTGRRGNRITGRFFLVVLAAVLALSYSGCGKKGPPFLPEYPVPPRVDNLQVSWQEGIVLLEGTVKAENFDKDHITGSRVFSAWYSTDNLPCETCPVEMNSFQEIQGKVVEGTKFKCEIEKGKQTGITYFQVRLMGRGGRDGPPSDRVRINHESF